MTDTRTAPPRVNLRAVTPAIPPTVQPAGPPTAPPEASDEAAQRATGWEIIRLRDAAGLNQAELANRAGVAVTTIRRYERGAAALIDLRQLRAIAAALGVSAGRLVDAGPTMSRDLSRATGQDPTRRPVFVLLPTGLPGTRRDTAASWRLIQYLPREIGQHWEPAAATEPDRTVSGPVMRWVASTLHTPAVVFGSAGELTGQRSWYVGALRDPPRRGRHDHPRPRQR